MLYKHYLILITYFLGMYYYYAHFLYEKTVNEKNVHKIIGCQSPNPNRLDCFLIISSEIFVPVGLPVWKVWASLARACSCVGTAAQVLINSRQLYLWSVSRRGFTTSLVQSVLTLVFFINILQFQNTDLWYPWINLLLGILFFDVILNGIVLLISLIFHYSV